MKKIIIPTDFSEHAQKAYSVAAVLAKKHNAEIELYTVFKSHLLEYLSYSAYNVIQYIEQNTLLENEAQATLLAHTKLPVFEGIKVSYKIGVNKEDLGKAIYEHINSGEYSYAVIGTEGDLKQHETFAEIIARYVTIPIITVRNEQSNFVPKNVLLCTDFNNINESFISRLNHLLTAFDYKITLFYVNTPSNFKDTDDIHKAFNALKRTYQHLQHAELQVYNGYTTEDGIMKYLAKNSYDLVALSTHGRMGLSHFVHGSLTENLINASTIPVFSYNLHNYNVTNYSESSSPATGGFVG